MKVMISLNPSGLEKTRARILPPLIDSALAVHHHHDMNQLPLINLVQEDYDQNS